MQIIILIHLCFWVGVRWIYFHVFFLYSFPAFKSNAKKRDLKRDLFGERTLLQINLIHGQEMLLRFCSLLFYGQKAKDIK